MFTWKTLAILAMAAIGLGGCAHAALEQQPFICRSAEAGLGQPLVDNQQGIGHPVFGADGRLLGHSRACRIPTRVVYFYYTGSRFAPYEPGPGRSAPPDLKSVSVQGVTQPFVVRVEVGTINRFFYTIAMLAPAAPGFPDTAAWNRKLVYWLRGGIGIGHQQGTPMWFGEDALSPSERLLMPALLAQGYAIVTSSGNDTGVHYNLRLAQQTAEMTKVHFIKAYGKPRFTMGLGGSGGAVQQYIFAQNSPGLLDGGVAIQSYPDMITQTMPISDCPLLGQYFQDEVARDPASPWARWSKQAWVEGMNASDTVRNAQTGGLGSTECINGWRLAMPVLLNPWYKDPEFDLRARQYGYPADAFASVKWTHWNDLAPIYGADSRGYAPISIDNVGVQYGLAALAREQIGADQFLRLNACVGGWKEQADFVPWDAAADPHDARNNKRSASCRDPAGIPAQRRQGDLAAMRKAYASGHVFTGRRLGIPMIDLRPYLEARLDMHNARQAFSVRARLLDANRAAARKQVIWFTHPDADRAGAVMAAVSVLDRYLSSGSAPPEFTDRCLDAGGAVIGAGPSAWDGILDRNAPGACTRAFPIFSSPRMVAGESIKGDHFKCALKPVASALADDTYAPAAPFTSAQKDWLQRIFPQGVCDYSRPDVGRP